METFIFLLTLIAEVVTSAAVGISIAFPGRRIWPPGREHGWGRTMLLVLFLVSGAGVVCMGILDRGSLCLPTWARAAVGGPLWGVGNLLALWGTVTLGMAATTGEGRALIIHGAYRYSRNPQYAGFILALAGWSLLTASVRVLVLSLAGIVPLLLVPFAEEPWLEERYGSAYLEYKGRVRRFFGTRKGKEGQHD